jgi:hypothetical protein
MNVIGKGVDRIAVPAAFTVHNYAMLNGSFELLQVKQTYLLFFLLCCLSLRWARAKIPLDKMGRIRPLARLFGPASSPTSSFIDFHR